MAGGGEKEIRNSTNRKGLPKKLFKKYKSKQPSSLILLKTFKKKKRKKKVAHEAASNQGYAGRTSQ